MSEICRLDSSHGLLFGRIPLSGARSSRGISKSFLIHARFARAIIFYKLLTPKMPLLVPVSVGLDSVKSSWAPWVMQVIGPGEAR